MIENWTSSIEEYNKLFLPSFKNDMEKQNNELRVSMFRLFANIETFYYNWKQYCFNIQEIFFPTGRKIED